MSENAIKNVVEALKKMGLIEAPDEELVKKIRMLLVEFRLQEREAVITVANDIKRKKGIQRVTATRISDLRKGVNANLKVKVLAVFQGKGKVMQRAIAGDPSGKVVLVNLTKFQLEAKKCYEIKNAYADEGTKGLRLLITSVTEVNEIKEEIEVAKDTFEGIVIDVLQAGFVRFCPECRKPLKKSVCAEHGAQDAFLVKFIVDNGDTAVYARMTDEKAFNALRTTKEALKELLVQTLDPNAIKEFVESTILGKLVLVKGYNGNRVFFVDQIEVLTDSEIEERTKEILAKVGASEVKPAEDRAAEATAADEGVEEIDVDINDFDLDSAFGGDEV
jgi:hypothetical protein